MHLHTQNSFPTIANSANEEVAITTSNSGSVGRYESLNMPHKKIVLISFSLSEKI